MENPSSVTAYFNGDPIRALKKGVNILDRVRVSHMAQAQDMFDFPPAPKAFTTTPQPDVWIGRKRHLPRRGEKMCSSAKASVQTATRPAFLSRPSNARSASGALPERENLATAPIKTFTLPGIKESLPYMHRRTPASRSKIPWSSPTLFCN